MLLTSCTFDLMKQANAPQDYEQLLSGKDAKIQSLQDELKELKRLIFGRKSERFTPPQVPKEQLNLFVSHPHEGTAE